MRCRLGCCFQAAQPGQQPGNMLDNSGCHAHLPAGAAEFEVAIQAHIAKRPLLARFTRCVARLWPCLAHTRGFAAVEGVCGVGGTPEVGLRSQAVTAQADRACKWRGVYD